MRKLRCRQDFVISPSYSLCSYHSLLRSREGFNIHPSSSTEDKSTTPIHLIEKVVARDGVRRCNLPQTWKGGGLERNRTHARGEARASHATTGSGRKSTGCARERPIAIHAHDQRESSRNRGGFRRDRRDATDENGLSGGRTADRPHADGPRGRIRSSCDDRERGRASGRRDRAGDRLRPALVCFRRSSGRPTSPYRRGVPRAGGDGDRLPAVVGGDYPLRVPFAHGQCTGVDGRYPDGARCRGAPPAAADGVDRHPGGDRGGVGPGLVHQDAGPVRLADSPVRPGFVDPGVPTRLAWPGPFRGRRCRPLGADADDHCSRRRRERARSRYSPACLRRRAPTGPGRRLPRYLLLPHVALARRSYGRRGAAGSGCSSGRPRGSHRGDRANRGFHHSWPS